MRKALFLLLVAAKASFAQRDVEEIQVHDPMALHNNAMNKFIERRKIDPQENLSHDGEFLKEADRYAILRGSRKADETFKLTRIANSDDVKELETHKTLTLPSPEGKDAFLSAAVTSQGTASSGLIVIGTHLADAVVFNEEVGLGAISKTGALPMGPNGEWLSLAEDKLKKEASLDYQALLWEMGTSVAESAAQEQGGLNVTLENQLLDNLAVWFEKEGGKLRYAQPTVTQESGFRLLATEEITENEPIVTVPFKLIMCKQTARNVLIAGRGKYLGEELQKTFEKNELWGMVVFLLHEYYKEVAGKGSKWGPFIRTLRMRTLSTASIQSLKGTIAGHQVNQWIKSSDAFMWWSVGSDGPCSPVTNICKSKPLDKIGENRFNIHQIRWAYWVVKQNAVRIKQMSTGLEFIALIPYYNMFEKRLDSGGKITFDLDGSVSIRAGHMSDDSLAIGIHPGNYTDSEFFLRYFTIPKTENHNNEIKLSLPGAIPKGSKFHYCMKGTAKEQNKDDCKASFKSDSMFWKSKVLTEWRNTMNLPPRLQELRMWATRLHLYGGQEEMALLSTANQAIAGLPIPVDQMPAEEQLMLMGVARDNNQAALIAAGPEKGDRPPPQLYSAPDPTDDWEAQRGMENLALLAVQAQNVISSGNVILNATQAVLNATRDFFQHGVLPMAGLDELDMFLLKKIGMLAHCGFENDMKIVRNNVTEELMCAMRVHLMNESEIHVFCPKEARVWEENCMNVEFANFTAISEFNELNVISALRNSIYGLLGSYPTTAEDDLALIAAHEDGSAVLGSIMLSTIYLRYREKDVLQSALGFLDEHELQVKNGSVPYQLELKALERISADLREAEHKKFIEEVKALALVRPELAFVEVDMGATNDPPKANLTLEEGRDLKQTVQA